MPTDAEILLNFLAVEAAEIVLVDMSLVVFKSDAGYLYRVVIRKTSEIIHQGPHLNTAIDILMEQFQ